MYGAAKILFYKTKHFADTLFTEYRDLYNVKSSRQLQFDMRLAMTFREVECPRIDILYNRKAARDLNLIADYPTIVEKMQESNFGALTDYEMEMFLLPQAEDQFLNEMRRFLSDQPQQISEGSMQVPPVDVDDFEVETVQIDAAGRNEFLMDVEDVQIEKRSISRKRSAMFDSDEHPAKKRKISSEEVRIAQSASVDRPLLAYNEVPSSSVLQVPPVPVLPRRRKRFADKETQISWEAMQKQIANVTTETTARPSIQIKRGPHDKHSHPAKYFLDQLCLAISHGQVFGRKLAKLFSKHTITRPVTENEFPNLEIDLSLPDLEPDETVRADAQSKIHERTVDISNKMTVTAAETSEQSKTAHEEYIPIDIPPKLPEEQILEESSKILVDKSLAALPEITGSEEIIGEAELSPSIKHFSPEAVLTRKELCAILEVHWDQGKRIQGNPLTTFHEIIPPDNYTKVDAARAFEACLEFHAEKRVVLKQAKPYDTIWIEKYARYSSESSEEDTV